MTLRSSRHTSTALRRLHAMLSLLSVTKTAASARQRRRLQHDLQSWRALVRERRALAEASAGLTWEEQAAAERLPVDRDGLALHRACGRLIAKRGLRRGETRAAGGHPGARSARCRGRGGRSPRRRRCPAATRAER